MARKQPPIDKFSEEYIRKHRTFPAGKTVLLVLCVLAQLICIGIAVFADPPAPQDRIDSYTVTVEPLEDGSLDITYEFVWTPLDEAENLTWAEIGIANSNFSIYADSVRGGTAYRDIYDGFSYVHLDLPHAYTAGETLEFSFKINQRDLLCGDGKARFYEFIPGWFNATPVTEYTFRWKADQSLVQTNADSRDASWHVWSGSMACGQYVQMEVQYADGAFPSAETVEYRPFDDSEAYDDLKATQTAGRVILVLVVLALVFAEVYIIDSYVSYNRGRGFLTGGGYHVHHYGRVNPRYRAYRAAQNRHSGSGSGRGCACACACACAGGGRAGCSQKALHAHPKKYRK